MTKKDQLYSVFCAWAEARTWLAGIDTFNRAVSAAGATSDMYLAPYIHCGEDATIATTEAHIQIHFGDLVPQSGFPVSGYPMIKARVSYELGASAVQQYVSVIDVASIINKLQKMGIMVEIYVVANGNAVSDAEVFGLTNISSLTTLGVSDQIYGGQ